MGGALYVGHSIVKERRERLGRPVEGILAYRVLKVKVSSEIFTIRNRIVDGTPDRLVNERQ